MTPARSRPGTEADAIQGVRPGLVYEPASLEEAAEVLRSSAEQGSALAFVGGGTDLGLGAPPRRLDAVLSTGRLDRILEHSASDQIVVVEAGVRLARLQEAVSRHGQRLALDPPLPERSTLGGIVASNAFGPRRARFGSVRDLILGVSIVRADGTPARGGGKVVKNVAGFDLPKLMVGSLGTLGLVTTATFRLHPLPEASATLLVRGVGAREVRALVSRLREAQLEPVSAVAFWKGEGRFDFALRFEGFGKGVAEQRERCGALGGVLAFESLDEPAAHALWSGHDALRSEPTFRAKVAALPAAIELVADEALPPLLASLEKPGFLWYATLGLGFASGSVSGAEAVADAVRRARAALAPKGGTLVLQSAPAAVRERVPVWGDPPPALELMQRVKERLDPDGRLSPGRFVGGL